MKKTNFYLYSVTLLFALGLFFGCSQEEVIEQPQPNSELKPLKSESKLAQQSRKEMRQYFLDKHNAGEDVRQELFDYVSNNYEDLGFGEDYEMHRKLILAVINPDDFICDDTDIPIQDYVDELVAQWTFTDFLNYIFLFFDFPAIDAIYFKAPGERQEYGINGEFTNDLNRTFKDLKRFWDIPSDDINMFAMKGTTYADFDRALEIETFLFPFQDEETSIFFVNIYQEIFGADAFWNYNHPLLSFNAFALSAPDDPFIQDRIVMGDGILTAYDEIGLGDVAPASILAHEYAHQVQFEKGYFIPVGDPIEQPAATRRTELMADAMAAYYLTHKRGGTYNQKRVEQFIDVFFNIGDCSFDSGGHHGTFEQRRAAAEFGFDLADNTKKKGMMLTADEFLALFEAELDDIINCDACVNK